MIFNELEKIFEEAKKSYESVNLNWHGYEARMKLGVKISRDNETGEIIIYDPIKGGDQYIEMQPEQYQLFFDHGWDEAIKSITLDKYKKNLNRLTQNIKKEMNSLTPNNKNLQSFKDSRAYILKKYYRLTR